MGAVKLRLAEALINWLVGLFSRKPVIGWRVFIESEGKEEDMGVFHCCAEEALEKAQMEWMLRLFKSNKPGAAIANMRAVAVRGLR